MKEAFEEQDQAGDGCGAITKREVAEAIATIDIDLGQSPNPEYTEDDLLPDVDPTNGKCVDLGMFVNILTRLRRSAREAFRENGGFSFDEIAEFKVAFRRYDDDNS